MANSALFSVSEISGCRQDGVVVLAEYLVVMMAVRQPAVFLLYSLAVVLLVREGKWVYGSV